MTKHRLPESLLGAGALVAGLTVPTIALTDSIHDCGPTDSGQILTECVQNNAGLTVTVPTGAQDAPEVGPITNDAGFSISLDGETLDSDPTLEDKVRKVDLALEQANVKVTFDGFEPETRLSVETVGAPRAYTSGQTVTLKSESNYPAFIERSEFRILDRGALGGTRLAAVVPVDVNGQASVVLPQGNDLVVVHRVYDRNGRFDETDALPLGSQDDRGLRADVEELANTAAVRNIPVRGGAVTVYADNLRTSATVSALGTSARPDSSGAVVIQRILPPGDHDVTVNVGDALGSNRITRPIEVPKSEWFYTAVGDITLERVRQAGETDTRALGRVQYYIDGETASGVKVTSSLDTGEEELRDIFRRLDEKDPRSVLDRIDPEDSYPTFGDDSEIYDNTPTSGRVYLRIEKDNNHFVFGDYQSNIDGNTFVRNERTLYGAQAAVESRQTTSSGEPRISAEIYAAQPEQLTGRETFRGTGGSVYFLRRQDITPGTETITVEIRDAVTGLVVDRRRLIAGRDYEVNYLQGVITLTSPLTGSLNNNLIQTNAAGDQVVNLVSQYEFTPTTTDVDGFSYGGRVEGWATDQLRFGATLTSDDTGSGDQRSFALDARYQFGTNSYVQLDWARSDGPGLVQDFSINGGLTIDGTPAVDGDGIAIRLAGQADLRDLGYALDGVVGGYIEDRQEGFSSLDYQVTSATGDERLYGVFARVAPTKDRLGGGVYADVYENDAGVERKEIGVEVEGNINARLSYKVGVEYLDEQTATTDGTRVDAGGRVDYAVNSNVTAYVFGQTTVSNNDLEDYNRLGIGASAKVNKHWTLEGEISEGTNGAGGRAMATYDDGAGNSRYFGYELDTGRTLDAGVTREENRGRYLVGGRSKVNESLAVFGENTYDLFDSRRSLTSAYGLEYVQSEFLTYDAAVEFGQVASDDTGDLDRLALSFGTRYEDTNLRATARLEFRRDNAEAGSDFSDFDAIYFNANGRYKIDEERRVVFSLGAADSTSDGSSVLDGQVVDASIGFAYRPIFDERLNMLARYRYLRDTFGQEIDGVAGAGARQESHVFSLEASYDLTRSWTLGGKIGGRFSQTSADASSPWVSNDAYLGVINARYHVNHKWDLLVEARHLDLIDAGTSETNLLGAVYRHVGNNFKVGVGYNFGSFSDDLTDLSQDNQGLFLNLVGKF